MKTLADLKCVPCRGGVPPLTRREAAELLLQVPGWKIVDVDNVPRLERVFEFDDSSTAETFTKQLSAMADEEDHHPVIQTKNNKVIIQWWTHVIKGLHRNDFIMAAKTELLV